MLVWLPETGELMTGERSRPLIGHHDWQAGHKVYADVMALNSPCRLSRGKPRLCAIASMSAAVQLAFSDP